MTKHYRSGFAAIIGRPNVGKSTLLNKILGQKIVITSDKPQTTRKRIRGIYNSQEGQIIFVDTPGIHKPLHKLGEFLLEEAQLTVPEVDLVLFLVDGTEKAGLGDKWIVKNVLEKSESPLVLVINKVDKIKSLEKRDEIVESYKELFGEKMPPILKVSAKTGRNVDDLIKNILKKLPEGPQYFPEEQVTDQNIRSISEEMIRERILHNTFDEIPHSVAVKIDKFEEKQTLTKITATIYIEHDSQKGILIGSKGSMLKKIGSEARKEIEELIENKVFLELFVKVRKDWRDQNSALKDFGYTS